MPSLLGHLYTRGLDGVGKAAAKNSVVGRPISLTFLREKGKGSFQSL